jgi:hypothetical protein
MGWRPARVFGHAVQWQTIMRRGIGEQEVRNVRMNSSG